MKEQFVKCVLIGVFFIPISLLAQMDLKKNRKFNPAIEFGYGKGIGSIFFKEAINKVPYEGHYFRLRAELSYNISQKLQSGIGFGLDGYHNFQANTAPAFLSSRYFFTESGNSLFFSGNLGYAIPLTSNFERGGLFTFAVGKRYAFNKVHILPSIGFNLQRLKDIPYFIIDSSSSQVIFLEDDVTLKAVSFGMRIQF